MMNQVVKNSGNKFLTDGNDVFDVILFANSVKL